MSRREVIKILREHAAAVNAISVVKLHGLSVLKILGVIGERY